jgi:imidazole glycerol-phosphate synthase subunit HisH
VIAVIDYGMGNLRSMAKALEQVGAEPVVTSREEDLRAAERIVLPGVGAFGEAAENLRSTGLVGALGEEVVEGGKPFLGVCLGMQLLAREGLEYGRHDGLGWVDATVTPLGNAEGSVRIPHTGWNDVEVSENNDASPFAGLRSGEDLYFNHSFQLRPADVSIAAAWCHHGERFVAAIHQRNIVATQFHPEKSQGAGLEFLADFVAWTPSGSELSPS